MMSLSSNSRFAAITLLLAAACTRTHDASKLESVEARTELVRATAMPQLHTTAGSVRAATVSALASRVVGNVTRVLVSEGDRVRAGQILIEIDDRDVRARRDQASAAVRAADQAIASASAAIDAAEANARFADATYQRYNALLARGSVSPHEFEEVAAKQKAARAELDRAQRGREQSLAQRAQAQAGASEAETFLSYTAIRSPIDGVVSARFVDPGAQAAPGMPLITVEDTKHYRVETTVDEALAAQIRTGDAVTVESTSGRIANIAPVDPGTRTALVKIDLPDTSLRSGTFVHVGFPIGTRNAVTVPAAAVTRQGELASVFVIDDGGAARMRLITLGDARQQRFEVLSGLDAGERIVSTAAAVREGVRIRSAS